MNETVKQVAASILAFAAGYAACMSAHGAAPTAVFDWACASSGFVALASYHSGLFQSSPTGK